jgi:hypothetical protein
MCAETASPVLADGQSVEEDLPFPVVHYPRMFGTFLAFAPTRRHAPSLCACACPAVENLLQLRPDLLVTGCYTSSPGAWFPEGLDRRLRGWDGRGLFPIRYVEGICHHCNGAAPALAYAVGTQHSPFIETYGWYVNQAYLRLGILPHRYVYLADVCPAAYQSQIETSRRLEQDFREQCLRVLDRVQCASDQRDPHAGDPARLDLTGEDIRRMMDLRQRASTARRRLKQQIEAAATQDFTAREQTYAHM